MPFAWIFLQVYELTYIPSIVWSLYNLLFKSYDQLKKEEIWQRKRSDKIPYTDRKIQKATWKHKNATKNFVYTTNAGRVRTVSWDNDSHPPGVVLTG